MTKEVVSIRNARKGQYRKVIEQIHLTDKCPFCRENFKYHKKPILKRHHGWFLTKNSWPYKNTLHHLIIIGEKHKESFSELTQKDFEAAAYLTRWAIKYFQIKGGAFAVRFGDTNFTGASVAHIHFQIISPKQNKKTKHSKTVTFPIGG